MEESNGSRASSAEDPTQDDGLVTTQVEMDGMAANGPTFILRPGMVMNAAEDDAEAEEDEGEAEQQGPDGGAQGEEFNDLDMNADEQDIAVDVAPATPSESVPEEEASSADAEPEEADEPQEAEESEAVEEDGDYPEAGSAEEDWHASQNANSDQNNAAEAAEVGAADMGEDAVETDASEPNEETKEVFLYQDNVGTESAPAKSPLMSSTTQDQPTAEEDLPDQVRSDVRPRTDRELEVLEGDAYTTEQAAAEMTQQEAYQAAAAVPTALQQPSQGTQADAAEDEANEEAAAVAAAEAAVAVAQGEEEDTDNGAHVAAVAPAATTQSAVEGRPSESLDHPVSAAVAPLPPAQAAEGTTTVVVTLEPMGCRTALSLPVHRFPSETNGYRGTGSAPITHSDAAAAAEGDNHWLVIAKDLFEAIARHLAVHPQSFHLFRNGERVRFMSTLFLDGDRTDADSAKRAEPLWLSVVFPPSDEDGDQCTGAGEVGATTSSMPSHLSSLGPDDVLVKCLYVRRYKPVILPSTLVEQRQRHGRTFDELIQAIHEDAGAEADPSLMAAVSVVHTGGGAGKPFIGGYRDIRDHTRVLHHASTQLFMKDLNYSPFPTKATTAVADAQQSRQTQTWGTSRSCQTHRECCVQSPVVGVVLDTSRDLVVLARPYFSAADLLALRTHKAIVLQKLYRQWKARALRRELEEAEVEKQRRAAARQRAEEAVQLARDELERLRRSDPRSANDFERLKEELEAWRAQESAYIRADPNLSEDEKREALVAITKQELKLLQELERHRRQAMVEGNDRRFDRTLEKMSSARLWGQVEVTTRESERARELMELYRALTQTANRQTTTMMGSSTTSPANAASSRAPAGGTTTTTTDEERDGSGAAAPVSRTTARLDILLHVKWTVKEFDSELTRELCQLIDREADLLHRGRKEASLTGLRQRIALLFKQFIEDPGHNPGMAEYTRSAVGRLKAHTLYGTVYNEDGSAIPGTTLVRTKDGTKKAATSAGTTSSQYGRSTRQ